MSESKPHRLLLTRLGPPSTRKTAFSRHKSFKPHDCKCKADCFALLTRACCLLDNCSDTGTVSVPYPQQHKLNRVPVLPLQSCTIAKRCTVVNIASGMYTETPLRRIFFHLLLVPTSDIITYSVQSCVQATNLRAKIPSHAPRSRISQNTTSSLCSTTSSKIALQNCSTKHSPSSNLVVSYMLDLHIPHHSATLSTALCSHFLSCWTSTPSQMTRLFLCSNILSHQNCLTQRLLPLGYAQRTSTLLMLHYKIQSTIFSFSCQQRRGGSTLGPSADLPGTNPVAPSAHQQIFQPHARDLCVNWWQRFIAVKIL